jgi:hypothetical protein
MRGILQREPPRGSPRGHAASRIHVGLVDGHRLTVVQVIAGAATVIAGSLLVFGAFQSWDLQRASATCVANGHTGMEGGGQITLGFGK